MNFNNSKYGYIRNDSRIQKALIAKDIEQVCHRRFSFNIHSGVRVKVQRKISSFIEPVQQHIHHESKSSSFNQINRMQSMFKRLWFESETSALNQNDQKSLERIHNPSQNELLTSYQTKSIFNNRFLEKNHSLEIDQKDKHMNSIGIQTTIITQIDRQISCNIVVPKSMRIQKNCKSQSSSSTSISETSVSDENSTHTNSSSTVSSTTVGISKNDDHNPRYRRNKNRNNNAIDTDIEQKNNHIEMEEFKMEKAIIQISNNKQPLQDININTQCYLHSTSPPVLSAGKKRFFGTFLNLFSFLRLSSFKHDQVCLSITTIETPNEENKNIRSPISRCRRSVARNFNHNSSIKLEKHHSQIKSEADSSSKLNHLEQKGSIHSVSDISISTRKQCKQKVKQTSFILPSIESNPSQRAILPLQQQQDLFLKFANKFSTEVIPCTTINPIFNSNTLTYSSHKILNEDKQYFSPPTDLIRLRVKNKNLISTLSKSTIPLSFIYPVNNSIQCHQMNIQI